MEVPFHEFLHMGIQTLQFSISNTTMRAFRLSIDQAPL